jgi:hypothetical protein
MIRVAITNRYQDESDKNTHCIGYVVNMISATGGFDGWESEFSINNDATNEDIVKFIKEEELGWVGNEEILWYIGY